MAKTPVRKEQFASKVEVDSRDNRAKIERMKQAAIFRTFIASPAYVAFKFHAFQLCQAPVAPKSLDEAIDFHFAAVRRSAMDFLFNSVETIAREQQEDEMGEPVVQGYRGSIFSDDDFKHL